MNIETISLTMSIGVLIGLIVSVSMGSRHLGALELKVDTMWEFQMRRAFSEVVATKLATFNSPLQFSAHALTLLDPLKDLLIRWWELDGHWLTDPDALLEIERIFGNRLISLVCVPCGLSHGSCLLLSLAVASQRTTVALVGESVDETRMRAGSI